MREDNKDWCLSLRAGFLFKAGHWLVHEKQMWKVQII